MTQQQDVLVIGGGVIGICAAYYLLKEGRQVTVLERDEVCSGASFGNSGLIVPSHSTPLPSPGVIGRALKWMLKPESPFYIKPRFSPSLVSWLWRFRAAATESRMRDAIRVLLAMSKESVGLFEELIGQEKLDCDYRRNGLFMLYRTEDGFRHGVEEARVLEEEGLSIRALNGSEVNGMEPGVRSDLAGGVYYEENANLSPAEFVHGLARRVVENGGTITEGAEVVGFEVSGDRVVQVRTTQGDFQPEHVVLAAGSWSPGLAHNLRFNLPVQPAKGYSVTFDSPEPRLTYPMILSEAMVGVNRMGSQMRIAGTLEMAGLDLSINTRRVNAVIGSVADYLVGDKDSFKNENAWSGLRPVTPDGVPVVGRPSSCENLVVATGHATMGMTLGPATGKLVAQIVCGQSPMLDLAALSPDRF